MRPPIDTRILVWMTGEPEKLPEAAAAAVAAPDHDALLGTVSVWGIA